MDTHCHVCMGDREMPVLSPGGMRLGRGAANQLLLANVCVRVLKAADETPTS